MKSFEEILMALRELRQIRSNGTPTEEGKPTAWEQSQWVAYQKGYGDAEQALQKQLSQQQADFLALQQGVLEALRQTLPQVAQDCRRALNELCLQTAEQLVAGMPVSAELVERVIQEALSHLQETTEYHIYLNPEDLALLHSSRGPKIAEISPCKECYFHPAPEVSRGGCLVRTRFGVIDGRRENKLELLRKALLSMEGTPGFTRSGQPGET